MREVRYVKACMTNLKGKKRRAVLAEIRSMRARPMDDLRKEADECMERILLKRKEQKEKMLAEAEELLAAVDEDAVRRALERRYLGETQDDNKLKCYADQEHMQRLHDAMSLLLAASEL